MLVRTALSETRDELWKNISQTYVDPKAVITRRAKYLRYVWISMSCIKSIVKNFDVKVKNCFISLLHCNSFNAICRISRALFQSTWNRHENISNILSHFANTEKRLSNAAISFFISFSEILGLVIWEVI